MQRVGQRPGDLRVRRGRRRTAIIDVVVRRRKPVRLRLWMVPAAFAGVILLGAGLLSLPISSESGEWTGSVALFTSASAVCVTGLVRVDTADHWSVFGEVVIALLIQAGGLGVTMYAGALLLVLGRRFGLTERQFFGIELDDVEVHDVRVLLRRVMRFVFVVEGATFALLLPWFLAEDGLGAGVWRAAFHAVSAFNNAGFDLMGGGRSMTAHANEPYLLVVMGLSAFVGSLSFVTVLNIKRSPRRWSLDTGLVAYGMGGLLLVGMVVLLGSELGAGRVLEGQGVVPALANSFFLSVNRTTGMATVDMAALQDSTAVALMVLMFIGGASTSAAGGIKIGSFMVSMVVVLSTVRGHDRPRAFGREIPPVVVSRAIAITMVGFATHAAGTWLLALTEDDIGFLRLLFEAMSALANVGWSQGVTSGLSEQGALVVVGLMFLGRLGSLLVALSVPERGENLLRYPEAAVRIG